jgi:hypothetical protein
MAQNKRALKRLHAEQLMRRAETFPWPSGGIVVSEVVHDPPISVDDLAYYRRAVRVIRKLDEKRELVADVLTGETFIREIQPEAEPATGG